MFLKKEKKIYGGVTKTYIRAVESYREDGKNKHRAIKNYGILEEQSDPNAFLEMVKADIQKMEDSKEQDITITIKAKENKMNHENNLVYNYGYKYLESIYNYLEIDKFLNDYQNNLSSKERYRLFDIFKFLVLERILSPDSKRASLQHAHLYYDKKFDFSLDDVYRGLDLLEPIYKDLQSHIRSRIDKLNINKSNYLYYDVTNYYCEVDFNDLLDGLRKRGVSKEHRLDPIVGLSLFIDSNGLPLSFQIFPGNQAESTTLLPGINEVKSKNNVNRIICIADKGLNTNPNILKIIENKDGYLFSQILRGPKGKRFHDRLFDETNWTATCDEHGEIVYKYKIYTETIELKDSNSNIINHEQKILIYWSKKEEIMQRKKREEKVDKAKSSLANNAYKIDHSFRKYLKKDTNEQDKLSINYELICEEQKYDGYFCLVTSELDLNQSEMRSKYHGLWEIEDTFKVTKTNLEFRPIYHYKKEHIISHFLICFTSLIILRLFQYKLKQSSINLSVERIINVLNRMNLEKPSRDSYHLHSISGAKAYESNEEKNKPTVYSNRLRDEDQIEKDCKLIYIAFNVNVDEAYIKVEKFNRYLRGIKFHTTSA